MKLNRRVLWGLALILILLLSAASSSMDRIAGLCRTVSVRWDEPGVSPAEILKQETYAREDQISNFPTITLWKEERDLTISNGDSRTATSNVTRVFGDCESLVSARLLWGSFPARSDLDGCAVSSALAHQLWGSANVQGCFIEVSGKTYAVRGVFEDKKARVLHQTAQDSIDLLPNMELLFPTGGGREEAEAFLARCHFPDGEMLDAPLLSHLAGLMLRIPMVLLCFILTLRFLRQVYMLRRHLTLMLPLIPMTLFSCFSVFHFLGDLRIPASLIPTRWSDFSFWQRKIAGYLEHLGQWLQARPTSADLELWPPVITLIACLTVATFFVILLAMHARFDRLEHCTVGLAAYMAGLGAAAFCFQTAPDRSFYLIPCIFCLATLMLDFYIKKITGEEKHYDGERQPDESKPCAQIEQPHEALCEKQKAL